MDEANILNLSFSLNVFVIADNIFPNQYLTLPLGPSLTGVHLPRICI